MHLYSHLDEWVAGFPNAVVSRGEAEQLTEPLMKKFRLPCPATQHLAYRTETGRV